MVGDAELIGPAMVFHVASGRHFRSWTNHCRPVQSSNGVALHQALPLSLTFDHRAVTDGIAARFLRAVIADLESAM
jgi:pyruvate dehydrogenase E2 component (dihydrolipoamide acetyltransferase)